MDIVIWMRSKSRTVPLEPETKVIREGKAELKRKRIEGSSLCILMHPTTWLEVWILDGWVAEQGGGWMDDVNGNTIDREW